MILNINQSINIDVVLTYPYDNTVTANGGGMEFRGIAPVAFCTGQQFRLSAVNLEISWPE